MEIHQEKIRRGVIDMFRVNMGVKPGERVTVISDYPNPEQWRTLSPDSLKTMLLRTLLAKTVSEIGSESLPDCEVSLLTFPSLGRNSVEPTAETAAAMKEADVLVMITSFSLTHTAAREAACRRGTRVASMPRFLPEMFNPGGPMTADYREIHEVTRRIAARITEASAATVKCPAGTNITFSLKGRDGGVDAGIYDKPGAWGNLPAGEAYVAPLEGTAEGRIVVQRGWWADLGEDMVLTFAGGEVVSVEGGGPKGCELRSLLSPGRDEGLYWARRNLAELGIGTNPRARRTDITLEAEKIKGTVHLAIGDGSHMGGRVEADLHEDFVIPQPTLLLDNEVIMEDGELLF